MTVQPLAGALGAEVRGLDISRPLEDAEVKDIRRVLLDHLVLIFRDQEITPDQHVAFARRFGNVVPYPFVEGLKDHPDIIPVVKLEDETVNFGGLWHADTTYLDEPPMGSILVARELPPVGGDTLFANMYKAYETLSEGMKQMLSDLTAISSSARKAVTTTRVLHEESRPKEDPRTPHEAEHPVISVHPETGRKALFVNGAHTVRFQGMTEQESEPILKYLFHHQVQPKFTCRVQWQPGTVVFYDNRCTQHNPINDYHGYKRVLHRITLAGGDPS